MNATGETAVALPRYKAALWYAAAFLACLTVLALNSGPLFYFDTDGYLAKGTRLLAQLGLGGGGGGAGGGGAGARAAMDGNIDGSHSMVYAALVAGFARLHAVDLMAVLNAASVLVSMWLLARITLRVCPAPLPEAVLATLPVLAAATTALPFYIAFLMPDIFAPVLILVVALLTVFARQMTLWELALAMGLGALSTLTHLSHLGIAVLLVPLAALGALLLDRRRWWLAPLLVLVLVALPVAEKRVFAMQVEKRSPRAEVSYKPFLTARMVEDGPGLRYLEAHCPDAAIPSCALWDALQLSDDPYRLTASHILFETSDNLGSFMRLPPDAQRRVAEDQSAFFLRVLRAAPVDLTLAIIGNALDQSRMVSVSMTVPQDKVVARLERRGDIALTEIGTGPLIAHTGWIAPLTALHEALYALSALALIALLVWPHALPAPLRVLGLMVLAGFLINALVCGGVSQPAVRYGARTAWLLPLMAVFLGMYALRARRLTAPAPRPRQA